MTKKGRIELIKTSGYIGLYDPIKKKRLPCNLMPNKEVRVKAKASAYEGGYTHYTSTDLHKELMHKRTVSKKQLSKLKKKYKCQKR